MRLMPSIVQDAVHVARRPADTPEVEEKTERIFCAPASCLDAHVIFRRELANDRVSSENKLVNGA